MSDKIEYGNVGIPEDEFRDGSIALEFYDKLKIENEKLRAQVKELEERLADTLNVDLVIMSKVDHEALQARVEELENTERLRTSGRAVLVPSAELKSLHAQVKEYEAALKYYADGWHYQIKNKDTGERAERLQLDEHGDLVLEEKEDVEIENGEIARAVLEKYKGKTE